MKTRTLLAASALLVAFAAGANHVDPDALLIPRRTWLDDSREGEHVAYAAAAIPGDGVVVAGTSGVLRYSIHGDLVWLADYPGTGRGVTIALDGHVVVAGTTGAMWFTPDGEAIGHVEGSFVDIATACDGTLLALEESRTWILNSSGTVLGSLPYPGSATSVTAAGGRVIVGGSAGAIIFRLGTDHPTWTAPYPGDVRAVALDEAGSAFIVGSAGVHAYDREGVFLWEHAYPGEAQAVLVFTMPEGEPWVLAAGTGRRGGRAHLLVIALNRHGEKVWESLEGGPDEDSFGYGLAADPTAACFYVVGATRMPIWEILEPGYRTVQYAPAVPDGETAGRGTLTGADCSPYACFRPDDPAPRVGDSVGFSNSSHAGDGHLVAWVWDFGDGGSSRAWSPAHAYARPGTYTVTLHVFDDQMCSAAASAAVLVEARPPEVRAVRSEAQLAAGFAWTVVPQVYGSYPAGFAPDGPTSLDDVLFTDRSGWGLVALHADAASPDGAIVRYQWDLTFDGQFDAEGETVSWSFAAPGVYPVTLRVTCEHGKSAVHATFVDTASFEPVAWSWEFGDTHESDLQDPEHKYERWGEYPVTLTVFDDLGSSDALTQWITVVNVPPVSGFAWEPEAGEGELEADFTWTVVQQSHGSYPDGFDPGENPTALDDLLFEDLSTAAALASIVQFTSDASDVDGVIVGWHWDFGDGATSDEPDPIHTYAEAGTYTVRLTVTDDAGDTDTHEDTVDIEPGAGAITAWLWDFDDGAASSDQHPEHRYWQPGEYYVLLTVYDAWDNEADCEKDITVVNVPPVAAFVWWWSEPPEMGPCEDVLGSCAEDRYSGCFCAAPEIPENTGTLRLDGTDSHDGEPWLDLADWEWWFDFGEGWAYADCIEDCDGLESSYLLSVGEGAFYRGDVDVTLHVWDEEGEGSDDYPFSHVTETITADNIPPYAGFAWYLGWSGATLDCESCSDTYGDGDAYVEIEVGSVTVSREIWGSCGYAGAAAILAPWDWGAWVELHIRGSGTVAITERIPEGWSYDLDSWWLPACVSLIEEEEGHFVIEVDLDACAGEEWISYLLRPPYGPVDPGLYAVEGFVESLDDEGSEPLRSEVVLCTTVNVVADLELTGYAWDPNEDDIATWDWVLEGEDGMTWEFSEEWVWATLDLDGRVCFWDDDVGAWVWSFDLLASLTVTDSGGASTTVEGLIPLWGEVWGGGE